jgi:hypothetical protein
MHFKLYLDIFALYLWLRKIDLLKLFISFSTEYFRGKTTLGNQQITMTIFYSFSNTSPSIKMIKFVKKDQTNSWRILFKRDKTIHKRKVR